MVLVREFSYQFRISAGFNDALARPMLLLIIYSPFTNKIPINFSGGLMALGKQAKILTDKQVRAVLAELDTRRYPIRDRVMFLLSIKAGLRAKEIASITWGDGHRCRG